MQLWDSDSIASKINPCLSLPFAVPNNRCNSVEIEKDKKWKRENDKRESEKKLKKGNDK